MWLFDRLKIIQSFVYRCSLVDEEEFQAEEGEEKENLENWRYWRMMIKLINNEISSIYFFEKHERKKELKIKCVSWTIFLNTVSLIIRVEMVWKRKLACHQDRVTPVLLYE